MSSIILILWDQLSDSISSLKDYNPDTDIILICEVLDDITYVKHHKKKIVFLLSAMRHFAQKLKHKGYNVEYIKLNDLGNTGSFKGEVQRIIDKHSFDRIIVAHPSEYRLLEDIRSLENELNIPALLPF